MILDPILDPILDLLRGKAVTIPPFDGALKPNTTLDEAAVVRAAQAPDTLAATTDGVLYSAGREIRRLADGSVVAAFDAPVSALAASPSGRLAVGLATGAVRILGEGGRDLSFPCPVALAFERENALLVCNGSERHGAEGWARDIMEKGASGSVWRVDLSTGARTALAQGLAFPYGVVVDGVEKRLVVSESWRHRLVALPLGGGPARPLLAELPAYPARIAPGPGGGYLLALFAPRNRLIEFVLLEDAYRADMMREIEPANWIAPALSPSRSFLEPLQNGGVRVMGIHKPWSPSRSYGLVVELDARFQPVASHHSRANGQRHGVTSAIVSDGAILAAAKGGDCILSIARQAGGGR